ncbi:MAG: amidohydrolase [Planctomycetes bacterium]|nr:amidohydrolase [Planctomycetota bacterium]
MIVDCYTHIWESPGQLGRMADAMRSRSRVPSGRSSGEAAPAANMARHFAASKAADATIVVGFKSAYLGAEISNETVAEYVKSHPERLIGFAGIDPANRAQAIDEINRASGELGMKGIAVSPAAQDLHPSSSNMEAVYEHAEALGLPVMFHQGIQISSECKLEYAQPVLLDAVAREYPGLKIIIAHLGYPWISEALVLLGKHQNVYSDISWLLHQPWQAYQALLSAYQYGVMDKLLFASGFPFNSATESIEALYGLNHVCAGTNFPRIPREALRGIVECDAMSRLGIHHEGLANRMAAMTSSDDTATA